MGTNKNIDATLFLPLLLSIEVSLNHTRDTQQALFTFVGAYARLNQIDGMVNPLTENGFNFLARSVSDQLDEARSDLLTAIDTIKALVDEGYRSDQATVPPVQSAPFSVVQ
jgi:hypothetical protein